MWMPLVPAPVDVFPGEEVAADDVVAGSADVDVDVGGDADAWVGLTEQ